MSTKAQRELQRSRSGLRVVAKTDTDASPFLIDEPHWTPDKEVTSQIQKCVMS